jgi:hypothetical protein
VYRESGSVPNANARVTTGRGCPCSGAVL